MIMQEQEHIKTEGLREKNSSPMLGIGKNVTPQEVLSNFAKMWDDLQKDPSLCKPEALINAKNVLLRHIVSHQMKTQRFFDIVSPFENSCIACHGSGELYKFESKTVDVTCHICAGKKFLHHDEPCPDCENGRYVREFPGGKGIDVECPTCHGTGKKTTTCSRCRGVGTIPKRVKTHRIKSTTTCRVCNGKGFTENKKPAEPEYPAIPSDVGKTLSKMIKNADAKPA